MFSDIKVLVVDDDYDIRQVTRKVLASMSFTVDVSDTLSGGLDKIEEADILLLDLRLKNGMGDTLLQRWRDEKRGPVIVMSGYVDQALENELLESYVDNVLHKPVPPSVLRSVFFRIGCLVRDAKKLSELTCEISELSEKISRLQRRVWILTGAAVGFGIAAGVSVSPLLSLIGVG